MDELTDNQQRSAKREAQLLAEKAEIQWKSEEEKAKLVD